MSDTSPLVVVSGLSGAGRSTAMKALEDLGFYCVDNLPIAMLESFVELLLARSEPQPSRQEPETLRPQPETRPRRLGVVVDVRAGAFLEAFPEVHDRLSERGLLADLLFLDASDEVLARRFDETRRVHPVARGGSLQAGIARERELLRPVAERASAVVDTSSMSVHELRSLVSRRYREEGRASRLEVEVVSFGFRYGPPEVADFMVDVRFLPNPNFEPALRDRSGLDPEVAAYVLENTRAGAFLERFFDFLAFLLPLYAEEGKAYLTIAIGCTGGRHRSVAIAGALERYLGERRIEVHLTHRDVERARSDARSGGPQRTELGTRGREKGDP